MATEDPRGSLQKDLRSSAVFAVFLPAAATGLQRDSKAQAELIRSVSMDRTGARVGSVPPDVVLELDEALRLHLAR